MSYNTLKSLVVLLALLAALVVFGRRVYWLLWDNLRHGRPSGRFRQFGERLKGLLMFVAGQLRLFRLPAPGLAHFFIFWGFIILSLTILQAIVEGLAAWARPGIALPILGTFGPLALLQDLLAVLVAMAVIYGLYVRVAVNPERYKGSHKSQGVKVLAFILTIVVSLLMMNGARIALGEDPLQSWRPVSRAVASLFSAVGEGGQRAIGELAYWIHLSVVLIFLTELPGGKHFHIVTSVPAVFLRNLGPPGRLPPSEGVSTVEGFRWRQMLDFYTCSECGRCQDVCPAYASGSSLSPKTLMMSLRDNLMERGRSRRTAAGGNGAAIGAGVELAGEVLSEELLWACTTCLACDQECPLFIEHVAPIVDVRRYLVLEGRMDGLLQGALNNLGRYGNSFGQSERARPKWAQGIQPPIKDARREPVEYLWFVGDYASYNASVLEATRKAAQVFQRAGLDFGILYEAERNAGNDVRRVGEEGLFEMLAEQNLRALEKCSYRALITTDPHTYNALRHEYTLGADGRPPILHYSELLDQLISSGQLSLSRRLGHRVTYHDPCYLGRYNGVYAAPRRVIQATGCELVEMAHHHDRAVCCGAGGGRIWMKEAPLKERPSERRIREAVALEGVHGFVVACPKDLTMYQDAVKTTGHQDQLVVSDLIELVYQAL